MHFEKDLVAAAATPLVLGILTSGESHGYAIAKQVSELSGDQLTWTDGMLYPLLHRLERLGYITARWTTEAGRKRKVYAITADGRAALAERRQQWNVMAQALDQAWRNLSLGGPAVAQ